MMRRIVPYLLVIFIIFGGGLFQGVYADASEQPSSVLGEHDIANPDLELAELEKEADQEIAAAEEGKDFVSTDVHVDTEMPSGSDIQTEDKDSEKTDAAPSQPLDVGFKKTFTIPRLNKTIVISAGQVTIPGFGSLIFETIKDDESGQELFRGRAEKDLIEWGPVQIAKAQFILNPATKDLALKASIVFLDKELAQASIEQFTEDGKLLIKCILPNPLWIPVSPWATFVVDAVYLEKDKEQETLKVYAQAFLKQHPEIKVDLVFFKDPEVGTIAEALIEQLPLSYVIEPLTKTPLNTVLLRKINFRKVGMGEQASEHVPPGGVHLGGVINFGGLLSSGILANLPMKIDDLKFDLVIGAPETPITLEAKIPQTLDLIPALLSLSAPKIVLQYGKPQGVEQLAKPTLAQMTDVVETANDLGKKLSMKLLGSMQLLLPVIGAVATTLESSFRFTGEEKGFTSFKGSLENSVEYSDKLLPDLKVSLNKCQVILARRVALVDEDEGASAPEEKTDEKAEEKEKTKSAYKLAVKGEATVNVEGLSRLLPKLPGVNIKPLLKQKIKAKFEIVKAPKGVDFLFEGFLAMPKPFKPFEKIPGLEKIQEVRDIEIKRLGLGFDSSKHVYLTGDTTVLGLVARVKIVKTPKGFVLMVKTVKDPLLTDLVPAVQGTPIQKIALTDLSLVISSAPYEDEEFGEELPKGLAIMASVALSGDLFKNVRVLVKELPAQKLTLLGIIGASLNDLILKIKVPIEVALGPQITCKNVALELAGAGPSISMLASMSVKPTPQDKPLVFTGRIKVDPDKASGAGTMKGEWKNPLGVKYISIFDCALEFGIDYSIFSNTGAPTIFGVTGGLQLGDVRAMMATKVVGGSGAADSILAGRVNKLDLNDLVSLVNAAKVVKIPAQKIPSLKLEDVDITIAPKGGKIGEIRFEQGVTVRGKLSVLDKFALVNIVVDPSTGFIGTGSMSRFALGSLNVTGVGLDKQEGTADDGPTIDIRMTPDEQLVLISGRTTFVHSKAEVQVYVALDGVSFKIQTKLVDRFNMKVEGSANTMKAEGILESDFTDYIKQNVMERLGSGGTFAELARLNDLNAKIAKVEKKIEAKDREINEKKGTMVDQERWRDIERQETSRVKEVFNWVNKVRKWTEKVSEVVRVPFDTAPLVKERAQLEGERTALMAARAPLQAAKDAFDKVHKGISSTVTAFEIQKATIKGDLSELVRGLGLVTMKLLVLGKTYTVKAYVDTNDMDKAIGEVVNLIKSKLNGRG